MLLDSPAGLWMLDTTEDYSANTNTLTELSAPPTVASIIETVGEVARDLDGTADAFSAADHATLDLAASDNYTLEAFVILEVVPGGFLTVMAKGNGYQMFVSSTMTFGLSKPGVGLILESLQKIARDQVQHLVGTKSGATVKLYVDGKEVPATITSTAAGADDAALFYLGSSNGSAELWNGKMQAAAIYPTALSAERICAHFLASRSFKANYDAHPKLPTARRQTVYA